jgi:hypothetical protein
MNWISENIGLSCREGNDDLDADDSLVNELEQLLAVVPNPGDAGAKLDGTRVQAIV